jgi:hypothetical protein
VGEQNKLQSIYVFATLRSQPAAARLADGRDCPKIKPDTNSQKPDPAI